MNEKKEIMNLGKHLEKLDEFIDFPDSVSPKEVKKMLKSEKKNNYKAWTAAACILLTVSVLSMAVLIPLKLFGGGVKANDVKSYGVQKTAKSYNQVYKELNTFRKREIFSDMIGGIFAGGNKKGKDNSSVMESIDMNADTATDVGATAQDASETNVQVKGVDEADVIKNDGRYIYCLYGNRIVAIDAVNPQKPAKIADFKITEQEAGRGEMFLQSGKRLIVVWQEDKLTEEDVNSYSMKQQMCAAVYNIENPSEPKLEREFSQDGCYRDVRMIENNLYLISELSYVNIEKKKNIEEYVPSVSDSATDKNDPVDCENIILPEKLNSPSYAVITAIDTATPEKKAETKAVLGKADIIYATNENLYVLGENYSGDTSATIIQRFAIKGGKVTATGSAQVPGTAINQFSVDDYNGYLRIGVTVDSYSNSPVTDFVGNDGRTNALFVLDKDMKLSGSIIGIAPTESIKSMRYEGDRAYMVTFRQTDPLYAIDLSDPKNPKITGKLKIPGFSQYMHPVGDGLMLGIGRDANEFSGRQKKGVKLSLFDVRGDEPKELCTKIILDEYTWTNCAALYNHKYFVDLGNNKYGFDFSAEFMNEDTDIQKMGFVVVKIQNYEMTVDKLFEKERAYCMDSTRGVRIKDCLILFDSNCAESYSLENYELKSKIEL